MWYKCLLGGGRKIGGKGERGEDGEGERYAGERSDQELSTLMKGREGEKCKILLLLFLFNLFSTQLGEAAIVVKSSSCIAMVQQPPVLQPNQQLKWFRHNPVTTKD